MPSHKRSYDPLLKRLYYTADAPYGFSSAIKLYNEAKKNHGATDLSLADVKKWLETQMVPSVYAPGRHTFRRAKFIVSAPDITWGMDLIFIDKLSRENAGFKYINCVVDMFSGRIEALIPQKSKTSIETARGLDALFIKGHKPRKLLAVQASVNIAKP